jgi:hypothetical protein
MDYEDRLVVYIDILGFAHAIARTTMEDNDVKLTVDSICNVFSTIRKHCVLGGLLGSRTSLTRSYSL